MVDVTGIDRDELLEALWREAKTAGFFDVFPVPPPAWDLHRAKAEAVIDKAFTSELAFGAW